MTTSIDHKFSIGDYVTARSLGEDSPVWKVVDVFLPGNRPKLPIAMLHPVITFDWALKPLMNRHMDFTQLEHANEMVVIAYLAEQ